MRPLQRPLALVFAWLLASLPARAAPVTVGVPAGSTRIVFAPSATAFASDLKRLLDVTASLGGPGTTQVGQDLERRTGLPLLDPSRLVKSGIDASRDWIAFDRGGSRYLGVWVRDREALAHTIDLWAASRLLQSRETKPVGKNGAWVAYSRAQGTRPACGYLIQGDRAVILLDPGDRSAGLDAALEALDDAVPLQPPVDGTLLVRLDAGAYAKEAWAAFSASEKGLEMNAGARDVPAGWLAPDASKQAWVAQAAAGSEPVLRVRLLAGSKAAPSVAKILTPGSDDAVDALVKAATGPVELVVPRLARAWKRTSSPLGEWLGLLSPTIVLPGRASQEPAVKAAKPKNARYRTSVEAGALVMGTQNGSTPKDPPAAAASLCGKGSAVLAASWSPAAAARSLDDLTILEAMGDDLLLGLYALRSEYGGFLSKLPGGWLVGCLDGNRLTVTARWPVRAPR